MKLTGTACRAARAILKWSVRDLAREAGVSPTTVNLLEGDRAFREATAEKIIRAFAEHDVEITNGDGTGARLRMGRGDLLDAFGEIVEALFKSQAVPATALAVCRMIKADARVTRDILPGDLRGLFEDLDGGNPPGTYGQGARRVIAILRARGPTNAR